MQGEALAAYEYALVAQSPLGLQHRDGRTVPLDVPRWLAPADATDLAAIAGVRSPALDVGCGPGRIAAALAAHGRFALGVDIAAAAVDRARARGVTALHRDVFRRLPGEGRWASVLLLDGNIGIGGDLDALLSRMDALLAADGRLLVETHPDPEIDEAQVVRFVLGGATLEPEFAWRYVGVNALRSAARRHRLTVDAVAVIGERTFVTLRPDR